MNSNDDAVVVRKNEPRLVVFLMKSPHHNSYAAGLGAGVHCMPTNGVAWKTGFAFLDSRRVDGFVWGKHSTIGVLCNEREAI